jgi:hypothetical protein
LSANNTFAREVKKLWQHKIHVSLRTAQILQTAKTARTPQQAKTVNNQTRTAASELRQSLFLK